MDRCQNTLNRFKPLIAILLAIFLLFSFSTPVYATEPLDDVELLARLVWLEARGEPDSGQQAVIAVVLNRLHDGRWGNTLHDVIFASGQFSPAKSIPRTEPTETEYANVRAVLDASAPVLPPWVMYFRANYDHHWQGYEHYNTIGSHWFGGFSADRRKAEADQANLLEPDMPIQNIAAPIIPIEREVVTQ